MNLKQEIKDLKDSLKYYKNINEDLYKSERRLTAKLMSCKDALADISVGLVPTNYPDSWSHQTKLQKKAADTLVQIERL